MSRSTRTLLALAVLPVALCAFLSGAPAGEEPTPAERFLARIEKLPPPAAEAAFTFEGAFTINGMNVGTFFFSAAPVEIEGETLWHARERGSLQMGSLQMTMDQDSLLSRTLLTLGGKMHRKDGDGVRDARWERSDTGFRVAVSTGEPEETGEAEETGETRKEETEVVIEHPGHVTHGFVPIILFCRMVLPEKGTYGITVFDPLPDEDEEPLEEAEIVLWESGDWQGGTATLVKGTREGKKVTFAFDPETREFLGFRMTDEGGMVAEVLPREAAPETEPPVDDEFQPPAKSAEDAALIAALAYGTGNGDLLVDIVHWPTAHAVISRRRPGEEMTEDGLREKVREALNRYSGKKPRDTVIIALRMVSSQIAVKREGEDRAVVTFPASFRSLQMTVGKIGESWFLIDLPGT